MGEKQGAMNLQIANLIARIGKVRNAILTPFLSAASCDEKSAFRVLNSFAKDEF